MDTLSPLILIVDDDPQVLAVFRRIAEGLPLRLLYAADAETAWSTLEAQSPIALLSDYRLPRMDGLTLLERAQARYPKLRCVLHTGEAVRRTSLPLEFPVVPKPCSPEELRKVLLTLLSGPLTV